MSDIKPNKPSVGDIIECLTDSITEGAPCSGKCVRVFMVCSTFLVCSTRKAIAVKWSERVEILTDIDWSKTKYCAPNDERGAVWIIENTDCLEKPVRRITEGLGKDELPIEYGWFSRVVDIP